MQIRIAARHFELNGDMKEFSEKHFSKLDRYFDHIVDCRLTLTKEGYRQIAEANLKVYGTVITAKVSSNDMYASIEKLVQKMEAQLKRYKEKLKSKDQKTLNALKETVARRASEAEEE